MINEDPNQETESAGERETADIPERTAMDPVDPVKLAEDRHLRLLAEFDNYRRRAARERESAFESGVAELARPLLDVLDNLDRALTHADQVNGSWLEGVTLTVRQFKEALREAGLEPVDPTGLPFDPRFHEAVTAENSNVVPADHVLRVVSPGYRLGDRILRPATVIVSQGLRDPADS